MQIQVSEGKISLLLLALAVEAIHCVQPYGQGCTQLDTVFVPDKFQNIKNRLWVKQHDGSSYLSGNLQAELLLKADNLMVLP